MARSSGLRSPLAAAARRLLIAVLFIATVTFGSSQLITEAAVGQVAPQPVLVETMPVGLPAVAARAVSADASGTTAVLRRHTRVQALSALQRAKPWKPATAQTPQAAGAGDIAPAAICGYNSLKADNQQSNCRIVTTYGSGIATSCSASKIGNRLLATAGHCIYSKPNGGWASSIDVYCTGSVTCNVQRSSYGTHITTTPSWIASSTDIPTAWDGAVIRTGSDLPGRTLQLAQVSKAGSFRVSLTGYPAQSGDPECGSSSYAGACYQYTSTDSMDVTASGMFSSSNLDLCSGHSGSGVMTADANRYVVAVVSGASFSPCLNYFVPQINSNNGVNRDCEKPSGGVSFACLSAKLPA